MTTKNCKRWVIGALLFASLALNVFLGGLVAGGPTDEGHQPPPPGKFKMFDSMNDRVKTLPKADQPKVQEVLNRYKPTVKQQMAQMMDSRDAMDKLFADPNYTRAQGEAAFAAMQKQGVATQQTMQTMMLDIADVLSPAERASFMQRPKEWRGHGDEFRAKKDEKAAK